MDEWDGSYPWPMSPPATGEVPPFPTTPAVVPAHHDPPLNPLQQDLNSVTVLVGGVRVSSRWISALHDRTLSPSLNLAWDQAALVGYNEGTCCGQIWVRLGSAAAEVLSYLSMLRAQRLRTVMPTEAFWMKGTSLHTCTPKGQSFAKSWGRTAGLTGCFGKACPASRNSKWLPTRCEEPTKSS